MKKAAGLILTMAFLVCLISCGHQNPERMQTIQSEWKTYYKLSDGTWECDGHIYKYRLEISGTMPNAQGSSTFVYLSNVEEISFEQAFQAAGLSSNTADYFAVEEAVLVDWTTGL